MATVDEAKAIRVFNKEFDKWLQDGSGGRKSEREIEWLTDVETDEHYKWRWVYKGKNYIWSFQYYTGKIKKITF